MVFDLYPENDWRERISCSQLISSENAELCFVRSNSNPDHIRSRHGLRVINHNFDKILLRISYEVDTSCVALCDSRYVNECNGGKVRHDDVFPITQAYWQGSEKTIMRLICWQLSDEEPDSNLQIHVKSEIHSVTDHIQELEEFLFVVRGSKGHTLHAS